MTCNSNVHDVAEVDVTDDCQNPGHTCFSCQGNGDCLIGEVGVSQCVWGPQA